MYIAVFLAVPSCVPSCVPHCFSQFLAMFLAVFLVVSGCVPCIYMSLHICIQISVADPVHFFPDPDMFLMFSKINIFLAFSYQI